LVDVSKPDELANAFALVGMAWGIGLVLGPALGGVLGQINLRAPAFFSAALALTNLGVSFFYLPESLPRERRETRPMRAGDFNTFQSIGAIGRLPGLGALLVVTCLFNFGFGGMNSTETLFVIRRFAALPWQVGLMTMSAGIAIAVVQALLVKRLSVALGEIVLASVCMLILVAGSVGMVITPVFVLVFPIVIIRSAASGFIFPILSTVTTRRVPATERGVLMGVNTALGGLMGIFSPIAAGLIYDHWSPGAPYLFATLFYIGAALLLIKQKNTTNLVKI
jgi:DHA1 family tetracycline resistance protein-like MFS transporter